MAIEIVNAVMRRGPRSSKAVRLVFLALAEAADEYGFCFPSIETLACAALCNERTVARAVQELERNGYIAVRRDALRGKGNVYFVNMAKLALELRPSGSCTRKGDGGPKNTMHLQLERAAQVRFASGGKPPIGEREFRAGLASGINAPIGKQDDEQVGFASGIGTPIGERICTDERKPSPDIDDRLTRHSRQTHPTFTTSPLIVFNRKEPPMNRQAPLPLPLSLAVEAVQKQVQMPPDEAKSKSEEPATANATATAGCANVFRIGMEHGRGQREAGGEARREASREARRWRAATGRGDEMPTGAGVPLAAGRVMQACGFTEDRLLRQIVTAMVAHLAADRSAEAMTIEREMIRAWKSVCGSCELMRFAVSPKYFFSDGRWAKQAMWPWDQTRLAQYRRAAVGR